MFLRNGLEYEIVTTSRRREFLHKNELVDDEGYGNILFLYHTGFTDVQLEESPGYRLLEYRANNILGYIQGSPYYAEGNYEQSLVDAFERMDEELEQLVKQMGWERIPLSAEYLWRTRYNTLIILLHNKKELYVAGASHLEVLAIRGPENVIFTSQDHIDHSIVLKRSQYCGPNPKKNCEPNDYWRYLEMEGKTVKEHPQLFYFNRATLKGSEEVLLVQSDNVNWSMQVFPGGLPRYFRDFDKESGLRFIVNYLHGRAAFITEAFVFALRLKSLKRKRESLEEDSSDACISDTFLEEDMTCRTTGFVLKITRLHKFIVTCQFTVSCGMDSKALPAVVAVSSCLLKPGGHVDPVKYELTPFDRIMRFALYQKRVLFYPTSFDSLHFSALLDSLKSSLAQVLVPFHPLCGRLHVGDDPVLLLDCSGELTVRFTEARAEAALSQLNFAPSEFNDSLCDLGCSPRYPWDPQLPLLFVQVTRFACGGVAVGIGFSHQVCDGVSAWQFMNAWAEVARTDRLTVRPEVTYGYKVPKNFTEEELNEYGRKIGFTNFLEARKAMNRDEEDVQPPGKPGLKQYQFDKGTIEKLKAQARAECSETFTSFEILCAHIWNKMQATRDLAAEDWCSFLVLVNCRGRINSIPPTYFGNAVASVIIRAKFGELINNDKQLSHAAHLIHEAIASFDEDAAHGSTAFMDKFLGDTVKTQAGRRMSIKPGQFTMVVSSPRHPVYECDFGFGRPVGVTFGTNDLSDAKIYLFPPAAQHGGGVDVSVCMAGEDLEELHL